MVLASQTTQASSFPDRKPESCRRALVIIGPMSAEPVSDEELLARYRASEDVRERDQLVNELFRRNYSKVARWCLRFSADRESAADLAQEIFARVYENISSFQGEAKFSTWLFSIARNHCLNSIRANTREPTVLRADVEDDFLVEITDQRSDPYTNVERDSVAHQLRELLNEALDETEKVVFTLHYGEDVPLDSITRLLGLENKSGAKAYIVSAKRKLSRVVPRWIALSGLKRE